MNRNRKRARKPGADGRAIVRLQKRDRAAAREREDRREIAALRRERDR